MPNASTTYKFFRSSSSARSENVKDDTYSALAEWVLGGEPRQYMVTREGDDFLVAVLLFPAGDAVTSDFDVDEACARWELERITTAYLARR